MPEWMGCAAESLAWDCTKRARNSEHVSGDDGERPRTFSEDRLEPRVAGAARSDRTGAGRASTARLVLACICDNTSKQLPTRAAVSDRQQRARTEPAPLED